YQPRELTRITNTNWTLTLVSLTPPPSWAGEPSIQPYDAAVSSAIIWDSGIALIGYAKGVLVQYQPGGAGPYHLYRSNITPNHSQPDVADWTDLTYNAATTYSKGQYIWGTDGQI